MLLIAFAALLIGQTEYPVEYKLAAIQTGGYPSNELVGQFGAVLDSLQARCEEPRSRLADMTVVVHDRLAMRGVNDSYLTTLQAVDSAIPADIDLIQCADIFAAYAVER